MMTNKSLPAVYGTVELFILTKEPYFNCTNNKNRVNYTVL